MNDNIFKYPLIQYIPLTLYENKIEKHNLYTSKIHINLYREEAKEKLNNRLRHIFPIQNNYNIGQQQLAILIINARVDFIKYRAYEVFMVGNKKETTAHLFKITTRYFYKKKLIFNLYNKDTAKKMDGETLKLT